MNVYLAGYNVDTNVIKELEEKSGEKREDLTPEVLSAAYARISRDPRPVNELRIAAKNEVERSRKSNSTIIFKMGHHSVAEHAVFNFDILGISRYIMEDLEKFRLCSFTEKSQRYITLDNDYVTPKEIKGTALENKYRSMISEQNKAYFTLLKDLKEHVFKKHANLAQNPKNHNMLEGWAKEDARYITALATETQVGMTINARNLELLLRRFASNPLAEVNNLGREIYKQVVEIAPSIVIFHATNARDKNTYPDIKASVTELLKKHSALKVNLSADVTLTDYTKDADSIIAATLIHTASDLTYDQCKEIVSKLSDDEINSIFKSTWKNMQFYDSLIREFEFVNLTYDISLSSACFGQLKRHRMSSIVSQPYNPELGIIIPENIKEIGKESLFQEIADKSAKLYYEIKKEAPLAAPYILTNAHKKRVMMRVNAREIYHISRLREDAHAQWDIQNVSREMAKLAKEVMPNVCGLIGGKDVYNDIYKGVFGELPKVVEAILPGAKKIK